MMNFNYSLPVNLMFGKGKSKLVGEVCKDYGRKALVVTGGNSTKKSGLLCRVTESLEKAMLVQWSLIKLHRIH